MQTPKRLLTLLLTLALAGPLMACSPSGSATSPSAATPDASNTAQQTQTQNADTQTAPQAPAAPPFAASDAPAYTGSPSIEVNGNKPLFTDAELSYASANPGYEDYRAQDGIARCAGASAAVGPETMPADGEERGSISMVKPAGWHIAKYDFVDGKYLYNRCHLIAWCLTDENANLNNLITGTRYMNVEGMLPYETKTAKYIDKTGNHVLYRSTPVYDGDDLLAKGVLIEAQSIEDGGAGLTFCVWCPNVQPGVEIDYADGNSQTVSGYESSATSPEEYSGAAADNGDGDSQSDNAKEYVLNTSSKKFHDPSCSAAAKISSSNRSDVQDTRRDLISQGYEPCGICKP